jgi:NTP pyrophosphatase (non-canonical NTP hydrolase)
MIDIKKEFPAIVFDKDKIYSFFNSYIERNKPNLSCEPDFDSFEEDAFYYFASQYGEIVQAIHSKEEFQKEIDEMIQEIFHAQGLLEIDE